MKKHWLRRLVAGVATLAGGILLMAPLVAKSQVVFGEILGTVTDPTGAAIPGATINVTDVSKGTSVTIQSNAEGEFTAAQPQGSKQTQVDGQAFGGVSYMLDRTDNQDPILGIIVINPNSDSLSEAKITTQKFDAEFGKAVASFITVQTKSGTNSFRVSLFDNRESNANLAHDPFSQTPSALPRRIHFLPA